MTAQDIAVIVVIGFLGGVSGGLLGIGGSIVMIPLLTLVRGPNQHLYQAACMVVNVVVAVSASIKHHQSGSVRVDYFRWMLVAAAIAVVVGVAMSNLLEGASLKMLFGAFLIYTSAMEFGRILRRTKDHPVDETPAQPSRALGIGSLTGFVSGLLGVGGGTVAVPLLRSIGKLPLRQAIGTSAAVMTLASAIGATAKNASIGRVEATAGLSVGDSLALAGLLAVPALLGANIGARLTYALPLTALRLAFALLIGAAGLRMLGLLGS
jgi:uncharacterized membrane protein YfcA